MKVNSVFKGPAYTIVVSDVKLPPNFIGKLVKIGDKTYEVTGVALQDDYSFKVNKDPNINSGQTIEVLN